MTELVPGLQGDIPHDLPKGIPYVAGRYVTISREMILNLVISIYTLIYNLI